MSNFNHLDRTVISTKVLTPTEIDHHYFMMCLYLCYLYQFQQAIYFILITLGQSPGHLVRDFGYFYMFIVYCMYWLRLFQLYFQRLSIVNPEKAQKLVSKIALWLQISKSTTDSRDNQWENNDPDKNNLD
tara:strand:- start:428 stop:817 length:390 start_codon:yes stop_codon:yes gene_type:complete